MNPAITAAVTGMANPVQVLRQAQFDKNTFIFEIDTFYMPGIKGPVKKILGRRGQGGRAGNLY